MLCLLSFDGTKSRTKIRKPFEFGVINLPNWSQRLICLTPTHVHQVLLNIRIVLHEKIEESRFHLFADGDDEGQVVKLILVLLLVLHEVGGAHLPRREADGLREPAEKLLICLKS